MAYLKEKDLVESALSNLPIKQLTNSHSHQTYYKKELDGLFGIPDFVIANVNKSNKGKQKIRCTFAFEAKLSKWKKAIAQAYRYKAFADTSWVILDSDYIKPALTHIDDFKVANIGLVSLDSNNRIKIHYKPRRENPYSKELESCFKENILVGLDPDWQKFDN